jgi:tetratricopeptide (TPR) repeat protein
VEDFESGGTSRGGILFCSSRRGEVSKGPVNANRTWFTDALLNVLGEGLPDRGSLLSFADVHEATAERVLTKFGPTAPIPVLRQRRAKGAPSLISLSAFPNRATGSTKPVPTKAGLATLVGANEEEQATALLAKANSLAGEDVVSVFGEIISGPVPAPKFSQLISGFFRSGAQPRNRNNTEGTRRKRRPLGTAEAIRHYDNLISWFGDNQEHGVQVVVSSAFLAKALALGRLRRPLEAIAVYDDFLSHFGEILEGPIREHIATALFAKADLLISLGKVEGAAAAFDVLLGRYGNSDDEPVSRIIARALYNKASGYATKNRYREEIALYNVIVGRFEGMPSMRETVAVALYQKGVALMSAGLLEEAQPVFDHLIDKFSGIPERAIVYIVNNAKSWRSYPSMTDS